MGRARRSSCWCAAAPLPRAALTWELTAEARVWARDTRAGRITPTTAPSAAPVSQVRTPFRVGEMKTVAALPTAIYQNVREDAM